MVDVKSTEQDVPEQPQDLTKLEAEKQELIETVQRLQAEFDNYRKRVQKDNQTFATLATENLMRRLLVILDTFDMAIKSKPDEGVTMIRDQMISVLEDAGLAKINTSGKFNPNIHEILLTQESEEEQGTILEELQKGYMLGDKIIRHSKVKIARNIEKNQEEE